MRYPITLICASLALPVAATADVPRVVADTPVVYGLVAQVMGDLGTPELLLDRGADPHNFQLRPSQATNLTEADVVFWVGPEFTPWLERALEGMDVADKAVSLLAVEGLHLASFGEDDAHDHEGHDHEGHDHEGHDHEGHDHEGHEHEGHDHEGHDHEVQDHEGHDHEGHDHEGHDHEGHDHEGHDHDGTDPHAWLNTDNGKLWLEQITATLGAQDPENMETYRQNADAAIAGIDALTQDLQATLAPAADAPIVMFHNAYGYFVGQFGLNIAGTIALSDAAAPGAARLAELRGRLADQGVVCIFPEVNHSARYVDVVVEGSDVRVGEMLDPAGVNYDGPPQELYASVLTTLANTIVECIDHDHDHDH
ncbi:zinc ABC transporter substrate-binding protein [Roseicitreum antarcticum]|uniref:High-affinity zinc uptake system protein ZnuA n=1 Tax=Roseicitreum antarcticum TaxID=564137 RepID=A0A1H3BJB8_9RHOB|nr:zinc ABC transporter substrate-binding protein [Roseicitreum antarcticum]SDX42023.1 zinc transport system substrate-binding protein [Roseicitreum antarcticum]